MSRDDFGAAGLDAQTKAAVLARAETLRVQLDAASRENAAALQPVVRELRAAAQLRRVLVNRALNTGA